MKSIYRFLIVAIFILTASVSAVAAADVTVQFDGFTDAQGNAVTALQSSETAVANFRVSNASGQAETVSVISVLYDDKGDMVAYTQTGIALDPGEEQEILSGLTVPDEQDIFKIYTLKTFVWKSIEEGIAYSDAYVLR